MSDTMNANSRLRAINPLYPSLTGHEICVSALIQFILHTALRAPNPAHCSFHLLLLVFRSQQIIYSLNGIKGADRDLDKNGDPVGHGAIP